MIFIGYVGMAFFAWTVISKLLRWRKAASLERAKREEGFVVATEKQAAVMTSILDFLKSVLPPAPSMAAMDAAAALVEIRSILQKENHIQDLIVSIDKLSAVMEKAAPPLEKIGDDAFLIAKGARDIGDQVAILRSVVFGGKRAEDFGQTANDDEIIRRGNMEFEIITLMTDHQLSRKDAETRVRDLYARVSR